MSAVARIQPYRAAKAAAVALDAIRAELVARPALFAELFAGYSDDARDPMALLCAIVLRSGDAQREAFLEARALVGRVIASESEWRALKNTITTEGF